MRVIALKRLRRFWESGHRDAEQPLRAWYHEAMQAEWTGPHDLKRRYAHASLLGANRVVFNIGGNTYRLVTVVDYRRKGVLIRWVGTHAEYDRIDAQEG